MPLQSGTQLGVYRLTQRLGAGGMGEVWKAEDVHLHRDVAIKFLQMAGDEESKGRLLREARTAGQLYHPNIATIHAIELSSESPYIVMEFVDGEPLSQAISRGRLSEAEIVEVGRSVADALAEAHSRGIIHRDIKPDNIILARGGRVKVLDFGIAKKVGIQTDRPGEFKTQAGVILGTVHYMSPEQARGKELDGRSDLFSLGVVMYEALSGDRPFVGDTITDTLLKIVRDDHRDLRTMVSGLSPELASIVDRCLKKNPADRFAGARELSDALMRLRPSVEARNQPSTAGEVSTSETTGIIDGDAALLAADTDRLHAAGDERTDKVRGLVRKIAMGVSAVSAVALLLFSAAILRKHQSTAPDATRGAPPPAATRPLVEAAAIPPAPAAVTTGLPVMEPPPAPKSQTALTVTSVPAQPARPETATESTATDSAAGEVSTAEAPAEIAKKAFRDAIDQLDDSDWRYLESSGELTSGAAAAKPLLQHALELDPRMAPATLRLALIHLFTKQFAVAARELEPLTGKSGLTIDERAMASFALSACTVARLKAGTPDLQKALDAAMDSYGDNKEFAGFADDIKVLIEAD